MTTALVTGSHGFIGRHLVRALLDRGVAVRRVDRLAEQRCEALDITHPLPAVRFDGVDVVIHLAALTGVAPSFERADEYHHTNVMGTARVVEAAARHGVGRIVVASSSSVYGECPAPAAEGRPLAPLSPYARSKVAGEVVAAGHAGATTQVVAVRPFTVFGPGQRPDMLIGRLLRGEPLHLWPFQRDFTPVAHVVAGIIAAATVELRAPFEAFNLGAGRPVGATALLDAVADVSGVRPDVTWGRRRPGEPARTWADVTASQERLGVGCAPALRETLTDQMRADAGPTPVEPLVSWV